MSAIQLLLIIYIILPVKNSLIAQVILSQIQGYYAMSYASQKLGGENEEETLRELWRSLWFDPSNTTANSYWGLFRLSPIFLSHQHGEKVTGETFTLVGETLPQSRVYLEVKSGRPLLGGLFKLSDRTLLKTWINADEIGKFQVEVVPSDPLPETRYYICGIAFHDEMREITEMTLVQAGKMG